MDQELIESKTNLVSSNKGLIDSNKLLKSMKKELMKLEASVRAKDIELYALKNPKVAGKEKLGPQKEGEGSGDILDSTLDSTHSELQTSTRGVFGDSEGGLDTTKGVTDNSRTPYDLPYKGEKRKKEV